MELWGGAFMSSVSPSKIAEKKTRFILMMLLIFSIVTYLDRVNISIAAKYIIPQFGFSSVQMGWIFSAFVFGYALLQIPGGWLGDRFGPRKVLTGAVIWWSVFTALTGVAYRIIGFSAVGILGSFIIIRFFVGLGEAVALPTYNRVIANWMAPEKRAWASGFVLAGLGMGGAIAPPFIALIMRLLGWPAAFYICSSLGIILGGIWYRYGSDAPAKTHDVPMGATLTLQSDEQATSLVNKSAGTFRQPTPWLAILSNKNVWLITFSQVCVGYVVNVYAAWFYLYLTEVRGFSMLRGSFYATGPFLASAVLPFPVGKLCDYLSHRYGKRIGRNGTALGTMLLAAIMVFWGARVANPYVAIAALSVGDGCLFAAITAFWATVVDIAGESAATVTGLTIVGTNSGGTIAPIATPLIARAFGWTAALDCAAALSLVGGLVWLLIHPERTIVEKPAMDAVSQ
ncbi:MAG TPA: MFS transporter [Candidatus Dormibacteraeota bacterium]|nr:MFS transporter [Candidatus Dormibacteraeota bacterium]